MYWPLGTPRVYSVNVPRRQPSEHGEHQEQQGNSEAEATKLLGFKVSRNGHLFATITAAKLSIWQTSPAVVLTSVVRSDLSLKSWGSNVSVLLRPDSSIVALQTSLGYLVTYKILVDHTTRVYQLQRQDDKGRRQSLGGRGLTEDLHHGQPEVQLQFHMTMKIEAGICKAVALDEGLVISTEKPAAVQCIAWPSDSKSSDTVSELLKQMPWMSKESSVLDIIYDRAMSLFVWSAGDGRAYAVQRSSGASSRGDGPRRIFRGYGFHVPDGNVSSARRAAINARFSLLAIGTASGDIYIYSARDYAGSIPLSHRLMPPTSSLNTGPIEILTYSPDGYCLFAGYEKGWVMWSVYGKLGASSFAADKSISDDNDDSWLSGFQDGSWIDGGAGMLFTVPDDPRVWILELARSAVTGCFTPSNMSRMLLQSSSSIMVYRGHDLPNLVTVSADATLWHQAQFPPAYLSNQRPIRIVVISSDGRYVAIAGRRGLAHYSVNSGRWKTFDDPYIENSFIVRGGMCWHQHILIAAVEFGEQHELRLYSREHGLNESSLMSVEQLSSPVVVISPTGEDSLLVYTYENILFHYVITASSASVQLIQVGQIGLHGIVRAPARVRAVTWHIPEHQLLDGDPSQDVVHASVLFLVDAKLVLLQPNKDENGNMKYDMRVIANDVEYFAFLRDQHSSRPGNDIDLLTSVVTENGTDDIKTDMALQDSLWYFNGSRVKCWTDVQDLLKPSLLEGSRDTPQPIAISTDFYPTSIALKSGVVIGIEPELVQRRDAYFAFFRYAIRTQLFLPPIIRHYLSIYDSPSALNLSYHYQSLEYFPHALEILLHNVLDEEVDSPPPQEQSLLPSVLSFLSSFPSYLDILVQCTRKTEVRSWRTLFKYLPPPQELFEESLQKGLLKTAGGYLLILHTFEELDSSSEQCIRLLKIAKEKGDWDLCKELARFLMALDESGESLKEAMKSIEVNPTKNGKRIGGEMLLHAPTLHGRRTPQYSIFQRDGSEGGASSGSRSSRSSGEASKGEETQEYFSSED